jgi:hypothetical protein
LACRRTEPTRRPSSWAARAALALLFASCKSLSASAGVQSWSSLLEITFGIAHFPFAFSPSSTDRASSRTRRRSLLRLRRFRMRPTLDRTLPIAAISLSLRGRFTVCPRSATKPRIIFLSPSARSEPRDGLFSFVLCQGDVTANRWIVVSAEERSLFRGLSSRPSKGRQVFFAPRRSMAAALALEGSFGFRLHRELSRGETFKRHSLKICSSPRL